MTDSSRVSVLINNCNYARFLPAAIDSALDQTYPRVEVVVVDDGSTDESLRIIERYGDRIVAVSKPNGGQASAFNAGFARATGDVVCLLDADDVFEPRKAAELVDSYSRMPSIGWCHHPLALFGDSADELSAPRIRPAAIHDFRRRMAGGKSPMKAPATSGLSFTRELLGQILPMPETLRITADNYIKFASFALQQGYMGDQLLAAQRIHGDNLYTRKDDVVRRAEVSLRTAAALRERFPQISRFADRLFAAGRAGLAGSLDEHPELAALCRDYLESVGATDRFTIRWRVLRRRLTGARP